MKHSAEAKVYATMKVGERGERVMPNEYEWDALASAFTNGQEARWIPKEERLPPYGQEVIAIHRTNVGHRVFIHKAGVPEQEERMVAWMPVSAHPLLT